MFDLRRISQSQFFRGSLIIFLGSNIGNVLNFLYNIAMGRLLGPERYGDLGAILSLFILFGVPLGIFNLFLVKIVSDYFGKKDYRSILGLRHYFTPRLFILGIIISTFMILLSPNLGHFLNFKNWLPIALSALLFILSGLAIINKAILQGTLFFIYLTLNGIVEMILKLILSIILVLANFGLSGALFGLIISGFVSYLLSIFEINNILKVAKKEEKVIISTKIFKTFIPVLLATLALTSFFTVDIILVKHFFPPIVAGEYVALSTIGKIIYYTIGPIITVMFPLISTRVSSGLPYLVPLLGTLLLSSIVSAGIIFIYFLFPKFIINTIFGSSYFGIITYLGIFSFFITIYSLNSILTHFLLSISYYKPMYFLFIASLLQGLLILIFHGSLVEIIWINIITSIIYLIVASFFVAKKEKHVIVKYLSKMMPIGIYGQ